MAVSARQKHERLARQAEHWRRGAEGEEATAAALAALPSSWVVIHDVAWPGRKLANIDHVVVGTSGVFVIDSKNWTGHVRMEQGVLRQNRYSRAATVRNAVAAAEAVAALIPEVDVDHVHAVLCFSGDVSRQPGRWRAHLLDEQPGDDAGLAPGSRARSRVRAIAASLRALLTSATDGRRAPIEKVSMGAPVTLAMPRATPRRRKRRSSAGRAVGTAASAAAAVALAVVITNGLTNAASDQPPPGDQQIQPGTSRTRRTRRRTTSARTSRPSGRSRRASPSRRSGARAR